MISLLFFDIFPPGSFLYTRLPLFLSLFFLFHLFSFLLSDYSRLQRWSRLLVIDVNNSLDEVEGRLPYGLLATHSIAWDKAFLTLWIKWTSVVKTIRRLTVARAAFLISE